MNDITLSLYELNNLIKGVIRDSIPETYWMRAETSDVRVNQNGHCYLEFIEKDAQGKTIVAKARAMIWSNTFNILKAYFEDATKQTFASGLKVLVRVSIEFHELYGFSLVVHDVDPSYTLGDQAMNRAAILKQLEEEGVLYLNKELPLPSPTQRIAIISSPTAAGYEDFCNQLDNNAYNLCFYTKLFPAIMQGDRTEQSIIAALEQVYTYQDAFDTVVIIRGGGATSDLSCFDSYLLAASCAQFPLPIITGIGHERDETVLDIVAHTRAKTPTAVAEFLIGEMAQELVELENIRLDIVAHVNQRIQNEALRINSFQSQVAYTLRGWHKDQMTLLATTRSTLIKCTLQTLKDTENKLTGFEKHIQLVSPENILKKGYSLTFKDGKLLRNVDQAKVGDKITTALSDGQITSVVI